jgi:hypothetical protein
MTSPVWRPDGFPSTQMIISLERLNPQPQVCHTRPSRIVQVVAKGPRSGGCSQRGSASPVVSCREHRHVPETWLDVRHHYRSTTDITNIYHYTSPLLMSFDPFVM